MVQNGTGPFHTYLLLKLFFSHHVGMPQIERDDVAYLPSEEDEDTVSDAEEEEKEKVNKKRKKTPAQRMKRKKRKTPDSRQKQNESEKKRRSKLTNEIDSCFQLCLQKYEMWKGETIVDQEIQEWVKQFKKEYKPKMFKINKVKLTYDLLRILTKRASSDSEALVVASPTSTVVAVPAPKIVVHTPPFNMSLYLAGLRDYAVACFTLQLEVLGYTPAFASLLTSGCPLPRSPALDLLDCPESKKAELKQSAQIIMAGQRPFVTIKVVFTRGREGICFVRPYNLLDPEANFQMMTLLFDFFVVVNNHVGF